MDNRLDCDSAGVPPTGRWAEERAGGHQLPMKLSTRTNQSKTKATVCQSIHPGRPHLHMKSNYPLGLRSLDVDTEHSTRPSGQLREDEDD